MALSENAGAAVELPIFSGTLKMIASVLPTIARNVPRLMTAASHRSKILTHPQAESCTTP